MSGIGQLRLGERAPAADFWSVFRRMRDQLAPMSATPYAPSSPHGLGSFYVRPDTTHNVTRDGTSYATAWGGFAEIVWGSLGADKTLWVCGEYTNSQDFSVDASGTAGHPFDIRLDYGPDPARIWQSTEIVTGDWTGPDANGEYYATSVENPEFMLYEDGERLFGCSKSSRNTTNLRFSVSPVSASIDLGASTVTFSPERTIVTGDELIVPTAGDLASLPTPLARHTKYYAIAMGGGAVRFAASYADALAGTYITLTGAGDGAIWKIFNVKRGDGTYDDPTIGALTAGQYWWDGVNSRVYYKPTTGVVADHELRISIDRSSGTGAAVYINNEDYVRVFGGGAYGGLFGTAPVGLVGQCHTNAVQVVNSDYVEVHGVGVSGCRSGIAFVSGTGHKTSGNEISDSGWHGIGGESGTVYEDTLLHERNYVHDVGRKHDFGDAQGIVFNRRNDDSVVRRNFLRRIGRDNAGINTGVVVLDTSDNSYAYRNIQHLCHGGSFEVGSGNAGETRTGSIIASNIVLNDNPDLNGLGNEQNFKPWCVSFRVQKEACAIDGADVFGNLFAHGRNTPASWYSEQRGVFLLRAANFADAVIDNIRFHQNAVVNRSPASNEFIFAVEVRSSICPDPQFTSDYNLFTDATPLYSYYKSGTGSTTYLADKLIGNEAGYWGADTGNDKHSKMLPAEAIDWGLEVDSEILEFLRQDDGFDTLAAPTRAGLGAFPFIS